MQPNRSRAAAFRIAIAGVAGAVVVSGVGLSIVYVERRSIGLRLATDYLRQHGVPAQLRVDRLDPGGFTGALILGPADDPDLSVDRAEVDFAPLQLGLAGLAAPHVRAVRLFGPVLKARLDRHGLSFGSLQRLVDEASRGGGTGGPPPDVAVIAGQVRLDTPAGSIRLFADGALRHGRLVSISARLPSAGLAWNASRATGLEGELRLVTRADRLHASWRLAASEARTRGGHAHGLQACGEAEGPYPYVPAPIHGRLDLAADVRIGELGVQDATARAVTSRLRVSGQIADVSRMVRFDGGTRLAMSAAAAHLRRSSLDAPSLALDATQIAVTSIDSAGRRSTSIAATPVDLRLSAAQLRDPALPRGLAIRDGATMAHGRLQASSTGVAIDLDGSAGVSVDTTPAEARRLAEALPALAGDLRGAVAMNLRHVRVRAADYRLIVAGSRLDLRLGAPMRADFAAGARAEVSPRPSQPVLTLTGRSERGGFDVHLTGPRLPTTALQVARWSSDTTPDGLRVGVESAIDMEGDAGPLHGGFLHARARIEARDGALSVIASDCANFGFAAFGAPAAPSVQSLRARLCPAEAPLLDLRTRSWTTAGLIKATEAIAPGAGVAVTGGEGAFVMRGAGRATGQLELTRANVADIAEPRRFLPVSASGAATLAAGYWTGALRVGLSSTPVPVGRIRFNYDPTANTGRASFASSGLRFAPHGLQPSSFAPAAAQWVSALDGPLELEANVAWAGGRVTSRGQVRTRGLDLQTPAGRVRGLEGDIVFGSLYPLATPSPQRLRAKALDTLLPLTGLGAELELDPRRLTLRHAAATLAGGRIALDPIAIPLTGAPDVGGTVRLDHVDFATVAAALGLADSVALQAKMSGVLPFSLRAGAFAVSSGRLAADGPGRLTIRREALGGAVATAGAAGAQPNAVQDFAYQALENLAFDALDAEVASLPQGRLGVVLHVHGRHDPDRVVPTRVSLLDLLAGRAFDKPLPLPKGTGVELTLDTSLNFDELLADYGALRKNAGSAVVQSAAPR